MLDKEAGIGGDRVLVIIEAIGVVCILVKAVRLEFWGESGEDGELKC